MEVGFHKFPSGKQYTYIKSEQGPIFLRNIIFLKNTANPKQVAIVHEWGEPNKGHWEPPKGQMEWKELADLKIKPGTKLPLAQLYSHMKKGIQREMLEEASVSLSEIKNFRRLSLSYMQAWPESGVPNAHFMYQYWEADMTPALMEKAKERIHTLVVNEDWKEILPSDVTEKDRIRWWSPSEGWAPIRGGFSKKMTALYFDSQ